MPAANANVQNFLRNSVYAAGSSPDLTTNITRFLNDSAHAGTRQQKWQRLWFNNSAKVIKARTGLVGFWRMNLASGLVDLDRSGNGNNATLAGLTTIGQAPALSDGEPTVLYAITTGTATVPDNAVLHVGDTFSIEMWVKRSAIGLASDALLFFGGNGSILFAIKTTDAIVGVLDGTGTILTSTSNISDITTWHHIAWTKSGAANKLYLDGVDVSGVVTDHTIPNVNGITISLAGNAFAGQIANVAFYNRVLTATEISESFILRP